MDHKDEKKIRDAILEGTEEVAELKDMVWSNIQKELNFDLRKKTPMRRRKKKISNFIKYGSIAAAVVIVMGINTQYGQAAVSKIKDLFVPNKVVKQQLEGMEEENNVALKEGSMKYIIYIDEERYTMEHLDGKDKLQQRQRLRMHRKYLW